MTDGMGKRDGPKGQDAPPSQTARLDTTTQNAYGAPRVEGASDLLRESEARFREFAEASSDVLWIRNAETLQWEYLSPAFEAVYGLSRERASQAEDNLLRWSELIVPEDRRYALNCMSRARDGEREDDLFARHCGENSLSARAVRASVAGRARARARRRA